jgi:hypothetical protein
MGSITEVQGVDAMQCSCSVVLANKPHTKPIRKTWLVEASDLGELKVSRWHNPTRLLNIPFHGLSVAHRCNAL